MTRGDTIAVAATLIATALAWWTATAPAKLPDSPAPLPSAETLELSDDLYRAMVKPKKERPLPEQPRPEPKPECDDCDAARWRY